MTKQFIKSIIKIIKHPGNQKFKGLLNHLKWQVWKAKNSFPRKLAFSNSIINSKNKHCGISALINSQGLYDYNNMNLLKGLLKNGGSFVDIGANIGAYSLLASEKPAVQVFAFEPHPSTYKELVENIKLNERTNITAYNFAISEKSGF